MAKPSPTIPISKAIKNQDKKTKHFARSAPDVLGWYDKNARNLPWRISPHDRIKGIMPDPYRVWLSEVMLQQTTVPAVRDFFLKFTTKWPTVFDLANAHNDDVMAAWAGLGYYARARNLHACAKVVVGEYKGVFPKTAEQLQKLPGIGPYTSAAIAAICADEQIGVLDGNVERVLARFLALGVPVREAKEHLRHILNQAVPKRSGDFAQALMDIGASICAPKKTMCHICPLATHCAATKTDRPTQFPLAAPKVPKPERFGHAFLVENQAGEIAVFRRPPKGLLGGMHQFLGSDWIDAPATPKFPVSGDWNSHGEIKHVFTHFTLFLNVWSIDHDNGLTASQIEVEQWVHKSKLGTLALPSLFKKVAVKAGYL